MNSPSIFEPSIDFEPSEIDRLNQGASTLLPGSFDGHPYDRRRFPHSPPFHHKYRYPKDEEGERGLADDDDDPTGHSIKLDEAELARLDTSQMLADSDFQAPSNLYGDKDGKEQTGFIAKARDSSYVERVRRREEDGSRKEADENLKPALSSLRQSLTLNRGKVLSSPHAANPPAADATNPFKPLTADTQRQTPVRRYPELMLSPPETAENYTKRGSYSTICHVILCLSRRCHATRT